MPGGRPSKYDPAYRDTVIEAGKEGQSKAEIAATLDVTRETVDIWARLHPEFSDALQRAHEHSLAWWERQARTNLGTSGYQAGLWKQAMSGRFPAEPYRERSEITGAAGKPLHPPLDLSGLTEEQKRVLASIPAG